MAVQLAAANKANFRKELDVPALLATCSLKIDADVVSFSGFSSMYDQLFCIASFVVNVGHPISWTIYSDGTYQQENIEELVAFPFVIVKEVNVENRKIKKGHLMAYPLLKKLQAFAEHSLKRRTIFCDSDILFFPAFRNYEPVLQQYNWYLPDGDGCYFDEEFLKEKRPEMYGVNSGFFILNKPVTWTMALNYINDRLEKKMNIGHWSEQTAIHLMMMANQDSRPLDPRMFVLSGVDSFRIRVCPDWRKIALRHFVGPVRHKMWQTNWKRVLKR